MLGQGAALEHNGLTEVLQDSRSVPVMGQPDVMVQGGYLGDHYVLPGSGCGAQSLG